MIAIICSSIVGFIIFLATVVAVIWIKCFKKPVRCKPLKESEEFDMCVKPTTNVSARSVIMGFKKKKRINKIDDRFSIDSGSDSSENEIFSMTTKSQSVQPSTSTFMPTPTTSTNVTHV